MEVISLVLYIILTGSICFQHRELLQIGRITIIYVTINVVYYQMHDGFYYIIW